MKKVAFVINVFREDDFHSGGERLFFELVNKSINKGYIVDLYCTKYLYSDEPKLNFNKVTMLGNSKYFKYPEKIESLFDEFKKLINAEEYDHVISENITPPIDIAILQGHSAKHYVDMSTDFVNKILMKFNKKTFLKYQDKWLKKGFNKIFVPSEALKTELVKNFAINKDLINVIYPGVDFPKEQNNIDFESIINKQIPLTFGISAPSFKNKGGYIFLKALYLLKAQGYDFKAKIIYPKYKKNVLLQSTVKMYGLENKIEFLPYQEDMTEFYNDVDVIAMPSIMETFGLVALEGMSYGKIPVVSSFSGAAEIISDSNNGFVFEMGKNDYKNLADKLKLILDNTENLKSMSEFCINTAKDLSWDKCIDKIIESLD